MVSIVDVELVVAGCQHISQKLQGDCAFRKTIFHDEPWAWRDGWGDEAGRVLNLTWQARLCHKHRYIIECARPRSHL
jgi:hypothetical protein